MQDNKWDLGRLDAGDLSALRHCAGGRDAGMSAIRAFYKACGHCETWQEAYWFPLLCMDALWRSTDEAVVKPMQECLKALLKSDQAMTDSLRHRIDMLLETRWDTDGFLAGKLLNLVKIIKGRTNLKPDFQMLADDLTHWNDARHYVQRKWLRCIYNNNNDLEEKENAD